MSTNKTESKPESKEEILDRLYHLVGLRKVKEEITWICEYVEFVRMRQQNGFSDQLKPMHMLFTGHPGTGKNTVSGIIGKLFCSLGILANGNVKRCTRRDLVQDGYAAEEQLVRQAISNSTGGILFIDHAGDLFEPANPNDRGVIALGVLVNILLNEQPEVVVILADDEEVIGSMLTAFPDLKTIFPRQLNFENYTPEELIQITRNKLEEYQYRFTPAAEDKFFKLLKSVTMQDPDFENGRFIDEQIGNAAQRMAKRLMAGNKGDYKREDMMTIQDEDIVLEEGQDPAESFEKLKNIIKEEQLKQSIFHHLNYVYFIRERQKQGFQDVMPALNMIFAGNPGTGKTTVAQMMADIYHSLGILVTPEVLVQDARNLTAGGVPPEQAAGMLMNAADGGVLYIDHACALIQNPEGLRFFESLLSLLSPDECEGTVVVLADYPDEMDKMLEKNPGLKSYFSYRFNFKDYTPEELMNVATERLNEKNYTLHPSAKEALEKLIRKIYSVRDKYFGNALLIDKLVGEVIRNMSDRIMKVREKRELTRKELTTVMVADIPEQLVDMPKFFKDVFDENAIKQALEDLNKMVGQQKVKKQIGDFVELARHYNQQGIKLNAKMSLQWCFTGNSGMGKSTVARIIARIYKAMGIIEKDLVYSFKIEKLIGQTEEDAQRMIGEALVASGGGVFFFDEDSRKITDAVAFRERVRAILISQMAERPGAYTLIYAGPQTVVKQFREDVEKVSDIVNVLVFEDYSKDELMQVLKRKLADEHMKLTYSAQQCMAEFIGNLLKTEERTHASARLMKVAAELMIQNSIQRLAKNGVAPTENINSISIVKSDVEMFTDAFITDMMSERKKIGFR